ncbi:MAG: radical SAM protein [Lachnospiraceae bacterium]|nr:radical SAM protein [Lachnospiraceae bacterium]
MSERIETRRNRTPLETVVPLSTPYVIYIDPCGACNFKCYFCPCNNSDYKAKERFQVMPLEVFQHMVDGMEAFPEKVRVVDLWAWGEPFLNKNLIEMIKYLRQVNVCDEIRACTNGSFLNPEMNRKLVDSGLTMLRVSLDAMNDKDYKDICGVEVSFDSMVENIRDLYECSRGKMMLSIKSVDTAMRNEGDVEKFYDIFSDISDYCFIEDIIDAFPGYDGFEKPDNKDVKFRKWNSYHDRANYVCAKPLVQMAVHSNGEVSACCNDWSFQLSYGSIKEKTLPELWNSKELRKIQLMQVEKPRSEIPYCKICPCESDDDIDDVANIIADRLRDN